MCFLIEVWEKSICRIGMTPGAEFTCKPGMPPWLTGSGLVMGRGEVRWHGHLMCGATGASSSCPVPDRDVPVLEPTEHKGQWWGCPQGLMQVGWVC